MMAEESLVMVRTEMLASFVVSGRESIMCFELDQNRLKRLMNFYEAKQTGLRSFLLRK